MDESTGRTIVVGKRATCTLSFCWCEAMPPTPSTIHRLRPRIFYIAGNAHLRRSQSLLLWKEDRQAQSAGLGALNNKQKQNCNTSSYSLQISWVSDMNQFRIRAAGPVREGIDDRKGQSVPARHLCKSGVADMPYQAGGTSNGRSYVVLSSPVSSST